MKIPRPAQHRYYESGQVLAMFAVMIPVLICFTGLAVDLGRAYVTKTTLSKAVDAAALAAMNNLNLGQDKALTIAQSTFNANYGPNPPAVSIAYTTDSNNNMVVNVSASTTVNTIFLGLVSGTSQTLTVGDSAQATRNPLVMALALDRSGSMEYNGGQQALPPAVKDFISLFDDSQDHVADVSFSTLSTVDVAMTQPFISEIDRAVNRMPFGGGTNSYAAITNAQTQIQDAPSMGPNERKVAVFFTDGWANMLQDNLVCNTGSPATPMLYGGCDPGDTSLGYCNGEVFMISPAGSMTNCPGLGFNSWGTTNDRSATFPSQQYGTQEALYPVNPTGMTNVANEADWRTIQVANTMRTQNTVIYVIGLGRAINQTFLQEVANDPASPTYNSGEPAGEAVFAPDSTQLDAVFQVIAAKILLRLTQ
ncbi:MAG: vWA domain-containing protein [Candidatus Binataceae bacterium]